MAAAQVVASTGYYRGHYYEYHRTHSNVYLSALDARHQAEGRIYCGQQGHLVYIESSNENEFVSELLQSAISASDTAYIGVAKFEVFDDSTGTYTTQFLYDNGEDLAYSSWQSGSPDNDDSLGLDCVALNTNSKTWKDVSCHDALTHEAFVVEYDCPLATSVDWRLAGASNDPIDVAFTAERVNNEIVISYKAPDPSIPQVSYEILKYDYTTCSIPVDIHDEALAVSSELYSHPNLMVGLDVQQSSLWTSDLYDADTQTFSVCIELQYYWQSTKATHLFARISFALDYQNQFGPVSVGLAASSDNVACTDPSGLSTFKLPNNGWLENIPPSFELNFIGHEYDAILDETTFTYEMAGVGSDTAETSDLRYFAIALPTEYRCFGSTADKTTSAVTVVRHSLGPDDCDQVTVGIHQWSNVFGIKWGCPMSRLVGNAHTYTFTLAGEYGVTCQNEIAVKTQVDHYRHLFWGPDCGVGVTQATPIDDSPPVDFLVPAFICDENFHPKDLQDSYPQGATVSYCVKALDFRPGQGDGSTTRYLDSDGASTHSEVYISDIVELQISQDNPGPIIEDGLSDIFTTVTCSDVHMGCRITTIFDQRFYYSPLDDSTNQLLVDFSGVVEVAFVDEDSTRQRYLRQGEVHSSIPRRRRKLSSSHSSFAFRVDLRTAGSIGG